MKADADLIQMMLAAGATIGPAVNMGALLGTPQATPAPVAEKPKRASKWGNIKTEVDGITFDSRKEAARFCELVIMQKAGLISGLRLQQKFDLVVNGMHICKYIADFVYDEDGQQVVEDVKGKRTVEYKLKAKLMKACLGITIRET